MNIRGTEFTPRPLTAPPVAQAGGSRTRGWAASLRLVAVLAVVHVGVACSSAPPLPSDVTDKARIAYYEGMARLANGDFTKATEIFQVLAGAPRHVRHASLAKLRLADSMFYQGRYAEATEMYRAFANQHRSDPNLSYARFRVAESYFKRLPTGWFLSPPAFEMDQTLSQQSEAELTGFLALFPTSPYAPAAREMLTKTRRLLFDHEIYAADHYTRKEAWQGVAWRLHDAFERFPEFAADEALFWRFVQAQDKVGKPAETMTALGAFVEKFPDSPKKAAAVARVGTLRAELEALKVKADADAVPELLDSPPDFRLKLPGSDAPEGEDEPGTDSTEDDEVIDEDATDDEGTPRLRPPTLPRLSPDTQP